jgi:hypothetical protein
MNFNVHDPATWDAAAIAETEEVLQQIKMLRTFGLMLLDAMDALDVKLIVDEAQGEPRVDVLRNGQPAWEIYAPERPALEGGGRQFVIVLVGSQADDTSDEREASSASDAVAVIRSLA